MSTKTVKPNNFAQEVSKLFKSYTKEVVDAINEETKNIGERTAEELRKIKQPPASESGTANPSIRRIWKRYAKNWVCEFEENTNYSKSVVRVKKYYPLTHLLEYGHATRDGKRTRAFKHVEPVNTKMTKEFEENIKKIVENGGK